MNEIKNEIIVIGGNHHNLLGVVRTLGEKGIYSNIIVTNENKYAFVIKSKYVKKYKIIKESEEEILEALKEYKHLKNKPVLIPTSDYAEYTIDKNLNELSKDFIVPNIDNIQGKIIELMDKFKQQDLANKFNINMANSTIIKLDTIEDEILKNIKYPCIIKPLYSIDGEKSDIRICKDNIQKVLNRLKEKGYKKVLVQDFLEFDYECGLIGCCFKDKVILPGIIEKQRIFPPKRGNVSYGKVVPIHKFDSNIDKIVELIKSLNYQGMFDIEIFKKGQTVYLNEINFRNSGNSYIYSTKNVNIVYLWVLLALNLPISDEKCNIDEEFYFIDEYLERSQLLNKNITIKEWFEAKRKASCYFVKNKKDKAPLIWKNIYAVLKRINK